MFYPTSLVSDHDPPRLKCPVSRAKVAEPGKLTATVSWDRPVATDTADGSLQYVFISVAITNDPKPFTYEQEDFSFISRILRNGPESGAEFSEGEHVIRFKVYDQARNMATCKFIVRVEGTSTELALTFSLY